MAANGSKAGETPQAKPAQILDSQDAKEVLEAAAAAFKAAAAEQKASPTVEAAFRLGWHMAELLLLEEQAPEPTGADAPAEQSPERLLSTGELEAATRRALLVRQIDVDRKGIKSAT